MSNNQSNFHFTNRFVISYLNRKNLKLNQNWLFRTFIVLRGLKIQYLAPWRRLLPTQSSVTWYSPKRSNVIPKVLHLVPLSNREGEKWLRIVACVSTLLSSLAAEALSLVHFSTSLLQSLPPPVHLSGDAFRRRSTWPMKIVNNFCAPTFKIKQTSNNKPNLGPILRWGWVFLERTRILSGIQFTTHFIEFFVVETKRFVGSLVHVILTKPAASARARLRKANAER